MGKINPENTLTFESSQQLFNKVKKRLSSFDALGLIDDGDFYDHVYYVLEGLGLSAYQECEAVIPICDGVGKMPKNLRVHHATFKLRADYGNPPTINEQIPYIYYQTETSNVCPNKCCIECVGDESKQKIVVRTFVNSDEPCERKWSRQFPMVLSPNVRGRHHRHNDRNCAVFSSAENEFTIDDKRNVHVNFDKGELYMQYYGLPFDENELPMVPDQIDISTAIEYRIYSQLFEEFVWNSTVPNIGPLLNDARAQFDFHYGQARYWAKLPSFQRMCQSIRRQRSRNKFWYSATDRTMISSGVPYSYRR